MSDEHSRPSSADVRETIETVFGTASETFDELKDAPDEYLIAVLYRFTYPELDVNADTTFMRVSSAVHILREQGYVVEGQIGTDEFEVRSPEGEVVEPSESHS